jgi:hypothetical protein
VQPVPLAELLEQLDVLHAVHVDPGYGGLVAAGERLLERGVRLLDQAVRAVPQRLDTGRARRRGADMHDTARRQAGLAATAGRQALHCTCGISRHTVSGS